VEEAREFFSYEYSKTSFNSIGCKEIKPYIDGVCSLDECVEKLKLSTRHYAKRQLTWFRRNQNINWIYPDTCTVEELYASVDEMIKKYMEGENDG
jgi:tRNA dimethylallyltransferase